MQVINAHKKQTFTCEIPTIGICNGNDSNEVLWVVTNKLPQVPPNSKLLLNLNKDMNCVTIPLIPQMTVIESFSA
jgi:hypothetical protein